MIRKICMLFILGGFLNIVSCCNCGDPSSFFINWTGVKADNLNVTYSENDIDIESTNDTILNNYGMSISYSYEMVSSLPCFQLFNQANACSCIEEEFFLKNKVKMINIVTLRNYDSTHLANSIINEYFFCYTLKYKDEGHQIDKILKVNESIENGPFHTANNSSDIYEVSTIHAILDNRYRPTLDNYIQFGVYVTLEDSNILYTKTKSIKLV